MITIGPISKQEAEEWIATLPPSIAVGILLSGERWLCVDHVVAAAAKDQGTIVGLATIASRGESGDDLPTIVALYVDPNHRGKGVGTMLLQGAVAFMLAHKMVPIKVDVLNPKVARIIDRLPEAFRKHMKINNLSSPLGAILET
jgi:GNAT superfamily N-acetyltransferase